MATNNDYYMELNNSDEQQAVEIHEPVRPTTRCKRCGCWLHSSRIEEDELEAREYCYSCQAHILLHSKPCIECGEFFFNENKTVMHCQNCADKLQKEVLVCKSCGQSFLPYVCSACKSKSSHSDTCHSCHWRQVHAEIAARHERTCRICGCSFLPRHCIVPECNKKLTDICSACHEEIEHMGMTATVWTLPDCPRCDAVITELVRRHRKIIRRDIEKLAKGEEPDLDAMAQFAITGGAAPLVFIDGRFLESEEIDALIVGKGNS